MATMSQADLQELIKWMLEECTRQREYRKSVTSMDPISPSSLDPSVSYIFDEEALTTSNDETKSWIQAALHEGYSIVVKGHPSSYDSAMYLQEYDCILGDIQELCPEVFSNDLSPSLHAYLVACSDPFAAMDVVFVTGNQKMLKAIIGEATREELHDAACARGFCGVNHYMFITDDGKIEPVILNWDDPTRLSHARAIRALSASRPLLYLEVDSEAETEEGG